MKAFEFGSEYDNLEDLQPFYASTTKAGAGAGAGAGALNMDTSHTAPHTDKHSHDLMMYASSDVSAPLSYDDQASLPLRMVSDGNGNAAQQLPTGTPASDNIDPTSSHFYHMLHDQMPQNPQRGSEHTSYDAFVAPDKAHAQPISDMSALDVSAAFPMHSKLPSVDSHTYTPTASMPMDESNSEPTSMNTMSSFPVRHASHTTTSTDTRQQKPCPPLEPSAITPASVFSKVSSTSTNDFLSPLTSPMLQPQTSQQHMYGLNEMKGFQLPPELLNVSPMQAPNSCVSPDMMAGAALMSNGFSQSMTSSQTGPGEQSRPQLRRSRNTDSKISRVRPSPLMKPVQSPKGTNNTMWQGRMQRDSSLHGSPSLGAIESLSNTLQDSGTNLSMPSPVMSPPAFSVARKTSSIKANMPTSTNTVDDMALPSGAKKQTPRTVYSNTSGAHTRHSSMTKSPSPIELSNAGASESMRESATPATPGTLMGLMCPPQGSKAGSGHAQQQHANTPTSSSAPASSAPTPSHAPTSASPNVYYPNEYGGMNSYQTQNAVSAVTASALINAAHPHTGILYPNPTIQSKPILPSRVPLDDRATWMHFRQTDGGLDHRRTSHKAAEQKRRDSLKHCFDELRVLLPVITMDDNAPGGSVLGADGSNEDRLAEGFEVLDMSKADCEQNGNAESASEPASRDSNRTIAKVLLLRHSNEYLIRLKKRIERRDVALKTLSEEVVRLRTLLYKQGISADGEDAKVSSELSSLSIEQRPSPPSSDGETKQPIQQSTPSHGNGSSSHDRQDEGESMST